MMFWIVMADQASTTVSHRHVSLQDARDEAERLARKHGRRFYVLEAIGAAEPASPPIVWEWITGGSGPAGAAPSMDEALLAMSGGTASHAHVDDLPF